LLASAAQTSDSIDPDSPQGIAWAEFRREGDARYDRTFFRPKKNASPSEIFLDVFLSQARLYVFADIYDVELLRTLVIVKMRRILAEFTLFTERVQDVYALIEYTFENTIEGDSFRQLVLEYVVCKASVLVENEQWDEFIRGQPCFASELLAKLRSLSRR
jgi:hypothetical protein